MVNCVRIGTGEEMGKGTQKLKEGFLLISAGNHNSDAFYCQVILSIFTKFTTMLLFFLFFSNTFEVV
jgi:hypothetical protein